MEFFSDYMDEACKLRTGHDNWQYVLRGEPQFSSLEKKHGKKIVEIIIIFEEDVKEEDDKL
tara:strand:+ start:509 stop:691 length:183 start_codon:yes stop_codon:yes gene_type:complete